MKFNTGYNATKLVDRLISETKLDNSYKDEQMIGIYLALDVWDMWVYRVYKDIDSEFNICEGQFLIESNKISKEDIVEKLVESYGYDEELFTGDIRSSLKNIESTHIAEATIFIDDENGKENWDALDEYYSIEEVEEEVGYSAPVLEIG